MSKAKSKLVIIDFLVTATSSKLFGPPTFIQPHHSFETSGGSRPQVVGHDPKWSWFHSFQVSSHYWNGTEHQRAWGDWVDESTFFFGFAGSRVPVLRLQRPDPTVGLRRPGRGPPPAHEPQLPVPAQPFGQRAAGAVPPLGALHFAPSKKNKKKTSFFPLKRRCPKRNRSP